MTDDSIIANAKTFIKLMAKATGHRSEIEVFDSFLETSFTAVAQLSPSTLPERRAIYQERYKAAIAKWKTPKEREVLPELMALCEAATKDYQGDFLGAVAAEIGSLSAQRGQFFTPGTLCDLMAALIPVQPDMPDIRERGWFGMAEPACGSGAMIIAKAKRAEKNGIHVPTQMFVDATDISDRAFKMCYIQLTVNNIPARVSCRDTLSADEPTEQIETPAMSLFKLAVRQYAKGRAEGLQANGSIVEHKTVVHPVRARKRFRK